MPKHTLPEDRRTELANWLTNNGINPEDVLVDADLSIIDTDNGRAIHYEATVRDTTGRLVIDARGDRLATEMRTVPLQTEPPKWWTPYVKPTREQLLTAVDRVRALHRNENGVCGWCKGPDDPNTSWDMEYWPCATLRATLDDQDNPAPEFGTSNGQWHWRCNGGQGCDGWVGIDLSSEDAARREYARHFQDEHLGPGETS